MKIKNKVICKSNCLNDQCKSNCPSKESKWVIEDLDRDSFY